MIKNNPAFWKMLDGLIENSRIVIDRPKASRHPEHPEIIYPLDYGYLAGTASSDGEEIDIWRGSADSGLTAAVVTADMEKKDMEVKLLYNCTEEEIRLIDAFYNNYDSMKGLLLLR